MTPAEPAPTHRAGLATYHRSRPGADRVVLVHGTMDRATSFTKVARRLDDLDVVRYDRRGYGRSVEGGPVPTLAAHVDDLLSVLDGQPAVVAGHSLGGLVALGAAQAAPGLVRAVAAFEAPMTWAPWWPATSAGNDAVRAAAAAGDGDAGAAAAAAAAAERFLRRMIGDARWERLPPSTRAARRAEGPALLAELGALRGGEVPYDAARLGALGVPVVAGCGSASEPVRRRGAEELAAAVAGSELVVIEGAGHDAHRSHPEAFAALVRTTLALALARGR